MAGTHAAAALSEPELQLLLSSYPLPLLLFLLLLLLFLLLLMCLEQPRRCLCGSPVLLSPPAARNVAPERQYPDPQIQKFALAISRLFFLKCQLQSSDGYLFTFKAEILQTGLFEFGPSGSKWL